MPHGPPASTPDGEPAPGPPRVSAWRIEEAGTRGHGPTRARPAWIALAVAVGVEFAAGLATLVTVPVGRPSGVFPHRGRVLFDVHAALGMLVVVGAAALVAADRRSPRMLRIAGRVALAGVLVAAVGGLATVDHGLRVLGIALMFLGSLVAGFAYLVGVLERPPEVDDRHTGAGLG